jgi:hypothetical protein
MTHSPRDLMTCRAAARHRGITSATLLCAGVISSSVCYADSGNSSTVLPTSGSAVKDGDIIFFRSDAKIFQKTIDNNASDVLCAPAFSRFNVQSVIAANKTSNSGAGPSDTAQASASNTQMVIGSFTSDAKIFHDQALPYLPTSGKGGGSFLAIKDSAAKKVDKTKFASDSGCNGSHDVSTLVDYDVPYEFTADSFQKVRSQRMGFTWGGLVVPYKFYVNDHSFHSNASAVGYVGYEGYFPGVSLAGIVALGPGTTSTAQATPATTTQAASTTKTTTAVTYTAATGVVATFGGALKFGLVVGWDWQGKGTGFAYEGKTWLALSIGAGF